MNSAGALPSLSCPGPSGSQQRAWGPLPCQPPFSDYGGLASRFQPPYQALPTYTPAAPSESNPYAAPPVPIYASTATTGCYMTASGAGLPPCEAVPPVPNMPSVHYVTTFSPIPWSMPSLPAASPSWAPPTLGGNRHSHRGWPWRLPYHLLHAACTPKSSTSGITRAIGRHDATTLRHPVEAIKRPTYRKSYPDWVNTMQPFP